MEQQVSALEITFGSFHLEIQQSILVWLVLCVMFAVFFIWAGKKIDKADPSKASTGVVYVCEEILNLVLYVIKGNLREKTKRYLPFFGTLILMMLVSNLIGLVGLQNPTSNVSFNATLQINGIKRAGLKARIKSLSEPMAILLPMNIVGEIALPLSMTMRLFGNILAGCIITMLIYTLMKSVMPWGVLGFIFTPFLHAFLDIFTGVIQTYIFFTLGSFFLGQQVSEEEA